MPLLRYSNADSIRLHKQPITGFYTLHIGPAVY